MQQAHLGNTIKNDIWITNEEDEATPDVLPELPGFHVLVLNKRRYVLFNNCRKSY